MTAADDRIDALIHNPPPVRRTAAQKVWLTLSIACTTIALLLLALYLVGVLLETRHTRDCSVRVVATLEHNIAQADGDPDAVAAAVTRAQDQIGEC